MVPLVLSACASPEVTPSDAHHPAPAGPPTSPPASPPVTSTSLPSATPTTVIAPIAAPPGWSAPLTALPPGGGFTSVSCLSNTFCIAAGGGNNQADIDHTSGAGVADSWDGVAWANPSVDFPAPAAGSPSAPIMPAISCTGGPLCVIVDGTDHVSSGDGTNWSPPSPLPPGGPSSANPADPGPGHPGSRHAAVTCPSPSFCAAVDNDGHTAVLQNGHWSVPPAFGAGSALYAGGPVGISCPSTSMCAAVVGPSVLGWDGTAWAEQAPWTTAAGAGATGADIACPDVSHCWAVSGQVAATWVGGTWSPAQTVDPAGGLAAIACPTATFCVAADVTGSVISWDGTAWSPPRRVLPQPTEYTGDPTSVSCPDAQFCMVLDGDGDYATFTGAPAPGRPSGTATPGP
jgi:hypothetical protein